MKITFETIYKMKDHEIVLFDSFGVATQVLRVPHGWIYTQLDKSHSIMSSVFVPMLNCKGEE